MSEVTAQQIVVYGNVFAAADLRRLAEVESGTGRSVVRYPDASQTHQASGDTIAFVDLEDDDLADPGFLAALANVSGTTVVGQCNAPSLEFIRQLARFGVAEILTPDKCVARLRELLEESSGEPAASTPQESRFSTDALIGRSDQIDGIRKMLNGLANVDYPSVLLLGETGTGKSLVAKILHHSGLRSSHNMVEVNCSAIPDELFESELFGHAKGAFTDAKSDKMGLFEYAEGGTLFLDEIGNLSASAQAKLLKILEDKRLRKVGSVDEIEINVRVVAATNLDLEKAMLDGVFREDLYYRLNLLSLTIAPLRERPEDIAMIASSHLAHCCSLYGKPNLKLTEPALALLETHTWPGNVRELTNVVERAVLLSKGRLIKPADIKAALGNSRVGLAERRQIVIEIPPQGITLEHIEQDVIKQVLDLCSWNRSETARFLGISRPRLRRIMDSAGLEQDRRRRSK